MLEVRLLGKFEIKRDQQLITISSRPAQSLFAYLILNAGAAHRREKLAGMLWPDSLEETARDNLRHALWRMRKALETASSTHFLQADDLTIQFESSSDYWLDAAEVEKLNENASANKIMAVLAHYQGELLPGFYDEWVVLEREHLYSIFEHHMARLMSLLQNEKRWLDILDWAERWIKFGQKPEPAYRALMSAHAAKGDMSKVAAIYERCVKSLREFGVEPSEQTKELYENLKLGKEKLKHASDIGKPAAKEKASNFPVPLTSFIGRHQELKEIAKLLSSSRLLTLTGPGGVGKTRLAIQTAYDSEKRFKDGVFWVGLVGLSDENLIPQEIAQSLKVVEPSKESVIEMLKVHLRLRELLLVLDNCEHLIRGCAVYAEQLLAACPRLKILATSIEALGLFNETTWQVPSLPLPKMQEPLSSAEFQTFASIELFAERAQTVNTNFALTNQNSKTIGQICHRLDGLPLAIELAAARTKVLSVEEIAARLDDRFSLLTAGSRTAIARHQTLRATIDWSYDLLTEPERVFLRRLSIFVGGFSLEAAEAVCSQGELKRNDILDLLGRLVDKSLVIVERESIGETRYRLLETIRGYALEKLEEAGEEGRIRDQHLRYFAHLAEIIEPKSFGHEQVAWFSRAKIEIDNLRAALDWSAAAGSRNTNEDQSWRARMGLQMAGSLVWFWTWFIQHGLGHELFEHLMKILSRADAQGPILERAKALNAVGFISWTQNRFEDARLSLEEALSIGRRFQDKATLAWTLGYLGMVLTGLGALGQAKALLEEGLEMSRQLGQPAKVIAGLALTFLGDIAYAQADDNRARNFYEEGSLFLQEGHDLNLLAYTNRKLGYLLLRQGDTLKAIRLFQSSLSINYELRHQLGLTAALAGLGAVAVAQKRLTRAAQLFGIVDARLIVMNTHLFSSDEAEYLHGIKKLRADLTDKILSKYWARGKSMTMKEVMEFALKET